MSWTIKKAERQRIDVFELWCWRTLLRIPWAARRSNQSILKEINSEFSSEGLMLKLKLQYFGHLIQRADSLEKIGMLGKIEGRRRRGRQRMRCWMASLNLWTWVYVSSESWRWTGKPGVLQSMGSQRVGHNWTTELNWTNWKSSGEVKRKHHEIDHIPESFLLTSPWRCNACTTRKNPESEWSAKDNTETNPITIKPKTVSHMVEQFFWVPLPYYSPPGCPSQ